MERPCRGILTHTHTHTNTKGPKTDETMWNEIASKPTMDDGIQSTNNFGAAPFNRSEQTNRSAHIVCSPKIIIKLIMIILWYFFQHFGNDIIGHCHWLAWPGTGGEMFNALLNAFSHLAHSTFVTHSMILADDSNRLFGIMELFYINIVGWPLNGPPRQQQFNKQRTAWQFSTSTLNDDEMTIGKQLHSQRRQPAPKNQPKPTNRPTGPTTAQSQVYFYLFIFSAIVCTSFGYFGRNFIVSPTGVRGFEDDSEPKPTSMTNYSERESNENLNIFVFIFVYCLDDNRKLSNKFIIS